MTNSLINNWKSNPDRSPLIVKGARQVGKTESIREFAKQYDNIIEINFVETISCKINQKGSTMMSNLFIKYLFNFIQACQLLMHNK